MTVTRKVLQHRQHSCGSQTLGEGAGIASHHVGIVRERAVADDGGVRLRRHVDDGGEVDGDPETPECKPTFVTERLHVIDGPR